MLFKTIRKPCGIVVGEVHIETPETLPKKNTGVDMYYSRDSPLGGLCFNGKSDDLYNQGGSWCEIPDRHF